MLSSARFFDSAQGQLEHGRLMTVINSLTEAVIVVNEKAIIELSNSVALSLLDTNSLVGKDLTQAMPLLDKDQNGVSPLQILPKNQTSATSRDYRLAYKDKSIINLYVNVSAVRTGFGGGKGGYVILFRDISREKSAEEERDEFISVASHELRNPVAVAEGGLSNAILLSQKAKATPATLDVLRSAHEQILFLASLLNDLAMTARADRTKMADSAEEFDASEVVKSLEQDYQAQAKAKGLQLIIELEPLKKLYGSRLYTREVLQNFITNAIKYTDKGSIVIKGAMSPKGVELSVTDSGIGIDQQDQTKLFEKFFRSQDSRVRQINGSGLGLYVSSKLARLMGGSINITSQINHGSTFTLSLPLSIKPAAATVA